MLPASTPTAPDGHAGHQCFLQLSPESAEGYIPYFQPSDWLDEAAQHLATVGNDERFMSKVGKSNFQLWQEFCELISQNPDEMRCRSSTWTPS